LLRHNIKRWKKEGSFMNKVIKFGEDVTPFSIPVLNEREIRAGAGILFLMMFVSVQLVVLKGNFILLKHAVTIFLFDFIIRVFVNPKFSPSLIIGRLIVRNQNPEYVGARQKKFAWNIGVSLAAIMFFLLVIINTHSPINGIICLVCLVFLFFESAFGICLGCKFYPLFFKEKAQYCPGEVCEAKSKQDIQKTSAAQILIVLMFVLFIVLISILFNGVYRLSPHQLFG
jgi:hypothetical protein